MSDKCIITGKCIEYKPSFGKNYQLVIARDPASKWEGDHPESCEVPITVSGWLHEHLSNIPVPGCVCSVEFLPTGRLYNGKRYVDTRAVSITVCGVAIVEAPPAPVPEPLPVTDEAMPF